MVCGTGALQTKCSSKALTKPGLDSTTGMDWLEIREAEIKLPANLESIRTDRDTGVLATYNITSIQNWVCTSCGVCATLTGLTVSELMSSTFAVETQPSEQPMSSFLCGQTHWLWVGFTLLHCQGDRRKQRVGTHSRKDTFLQ